VHRAASVLRAGALAVHDQPLFRRPAVCPDPGGRHRRTPSAYALDRGAERPSRTCSG